MSDLLLTHAVRLRAALALSAGSVVAWLLYNGTATHTGVIACPSRLVLNIPCPSCGMTRAFAALTHLDLAYAMRANTASPLIFALVIALAVGYIAQLISGKSYVSIAWGVVRVRRTIAAAVLVVMAVTWVINLHRHAHGEGPLHLAPASYAAE